MQGPCAELPLPLSHLRSDLWVEVLLTQGRGHRKPGLAIEGARPPPHEHRLSSTGSAPPPSRQTTPRRGAGVSAELHRRRRRALDQAFSASAPLTTGPDSSLSQGRCSLEDSQQRPWQSAEIPGASPHQVMTIKNVSRDCQMSPEGQSHPHLRTAALGRVTPSVISTSKTHTLIANE